tara:strand:- start:166 stop:381 length:216 start_codon:yes stop_codon:yes gene_type:complete
MAAKDPADPKHYNQLKIQPRDYITENKLDYNEGNVIKYVTRWRHKNGLEDLLKAKNYLDYLIEKEKQKLSK